MILIAGGVFLLLCRDAEGVFYSPQLTGLMILRFNKAQDSSEPDYLPTAGGGKVTDSCFLKGISRKRNPNSSTEDLLVAFPMLT